MALALVLKINSMLLVLIALVGVEVKIELLTMKMMRTIFRSLSMVEIRRRTKHQRELH